METATQITAGKVARVSLAIPNPVRIVCRILLIVLIFTIAFNDLASAASKKFIKGFLLGAYMAQKKKPIIVHVEKPKKG